MRKRPTSKVLTGVTKTATLLKRARTKTHRVKRGQKLPKRLTMSTTIPRRSSSPHTKRTSKKAKGHMEATVKTSTTLQARKSLRNRSTGLYKALNSRVKLSLTTSITYHLTLAPTVAYTTINALSSANVESGSAMERVKISSGATSSGTW